MKAFPCQFCESKFTTPAGKKQHEKTHIGDKSYCCKFCDKSYVTSGKLRTHVFTKHADEIHENSPNNELKHETPTRSYQISVTKIISHKMRKHVHSIYH